MVKGTALFAKACKVLQTVHNLQISRGLLSRYLANGKHHKHDEDKLKFRGLLVEMRGLR